MTFNQNPNYTHMQRQSPPCKYCGRTNHLSLWCRYRKIHLDRITRREDGGLKKVFCYNKPETDLSMKSKEKDKFPNTTKKTSLATTNLCSKSSKLNKNPNDLKTNITNDGILTIDTKDYLKCNTCIKWEMRLHEKMKLMDKIAEENIRLNKEVKLLKELYNVQCQTQGKKKI